MTDSIFTWNVDRRSIILNRKIYFGLVKTITATGTGVELRDVWLDTQTLKDGRIYFDYKHLYYPYVHITDSLKYLQSKSDSITYQLLLVTFD